MSDTARDEHPEHDDDWPAPGTVLTLTDLDRPGLPPGPAPAADDDRPDVDDTQDHAPHAEHTRPALAGDAALVAAMIEQGVDPGPLLGHGERPTVRARLRALLGLDAPADDAAAPAPSLGALGDDLAGMTPSARLTRVEELAADGDSRVTAELLAQARADVDLERLRQPANARRVAADRVARLEALARDVLDVLDDDDPDLAAARDAWVQCVAAARRAITAAERWQARVEGPIGAFDSVRHLRAYVDASSPLIDEAVARTVVAGTLGAHREAFTHALDVALDPHATRRAASMWGRIHETTSPRH